MRFCPSLTASPLTCLPPSVSSPTMSFHEFQNVSLDKYIRGLCVHIWNELTWSHFPALWFDLIPKLRMCSVSVWSRANSPWSPHFGTWTKMSVILGLFVVAPMSALCLTVTNVTGVPEILDLRAQQPWPRHRLTQKKDRLLVISSFIRSLGPATKGKLVSNSTVSEGINPVHVQVAKWSRSSAAWVWTGPSEPRDPLVLPPRLPL